MPWLADDARFALRDWAPEGMIDEHPFTPGPAK